MYYSLPSTIIVLTVKKFGITIMCIQISVARSHHKGPVNATSPSFHVVILPSGQADSRDTTRVTVSTFSVMLPWYQIARSKASVRLLCSGIIKATNGICAGRIMRRRRKVIRLAILPLISICRWDNVREYAVHTWFPIREFLTSLRTWFQMNWNYVNGGWYGIDCYSVHSKWIVEWIVIL